MRRDNPIVGGSLSRRLRRLSLLDRIEEAWIFQRQYFDALQIGKTAAGRRWSEVSRGLLRHGYYEHTPEELAFGARLAWRNHARCIGRLFWESLEVFDARHVTEVDAMADRLAGHLVHAANGGRIRSTITIFAPVRGVYLPAYVESAQLVQYACHSAPEGRQLGDRRNADVTRIARSLGWTAPERPGAFDILPVLLRDASDRRVLMDLPEGSVMEVPISHPDCDAISRLGLRWHAVPVVSNMILTIGGVDYPCAPFNGFYMSTEIASRNLADRDRYDKLPDVARALGMQPEARGTSFWQDTALTELNRAVVHSFKKAGVALVDHHTASDQFMEFVSRENIAGRRVAANWSWIVPPQASAACDVFHMPMKDHSAVPNYYRSRGEDGRTLMPFYGDYHRSRLVQRTDDLRRTWRRWYQRG
ncbi:nitric oxide synthase oxygenase [Sulfitobacter sp. D35]|uniref:nitric oxide synthase oxygenase n=1 Tax=Sulfitobacter sp. D35 TaxID=3083252 RepID=UPI00296EF786|nr:nitric oxide synthase oxygenase [Sulfitobacter sp. D35]MDW4500568.1 nitric oxide synthase oxygenase [Sulfitobacter sp. D35]